MKQLAIVLSLLLLSTFVFAGYGDPETSTPAILSGIISLITLIVFFIMSSNISKIKNELASKGPEGYHADYQKFLAFGDKERALLALREYAWLRMQFIKSNFGSNRESEYQKIKDKFQTKFEELGSTFPAFPE